MNKDCDDVMFPSNSSKELLHHSHVNTGVGHKDKVVLTQDVLLTAVKDTRPSISEEEREKYSKM